MRPHSPQTVAISLFHPLLPPVVVGRLEFFKRGDGRQCLYRRQGLTFDHLHNSQIPLSGYISCLIQSEPRLVPINSLKGTPGRTACVLLHFSPLLPLFFDPILDLPASHFRPLFYFVLFLYFLSLILISWSRHCLFNNPFSIPTGPE